MAAVTVFVFLCAMFWHSTGPAEWEWRFITAARHHPPPGPNTWRSIFEPVPFALITLTIALIALLDRRPRLALSGTAGCVFAVVAAEKVFKPLVDRRQTFHRFRWFDPPGHIGALTFPSGHVAAAASCAMFAWFVLGRRTPLAALAFVVPVVVAWAMISLDQHYPADTLAGFLLGPLVVSATVIGFGHVLGRDDPAPRPAPAADTDR